MNLEAQSAAAKLCSPLSTCKRYLYHYYVFININVQLRQSIFKPAVFQMHIYLLIIYTTQFMSTYS